MAELSFSELRYRRLFEAARDGILMVDPDTRQIIDVNPFLIEFLGYSYEEFMGKELFQIGLLKDEPASQAAFRELQAVGYIRYEDLPLKTKDGRRVDVEFVSNVYTEGDQQVVQCNIRDISARKRSQCALRESEERFKLVARAVSDVIWDWNLETDKLWWSEGLLTVFGYSESENEGYLASRNSRIHPDEIRRVDDGIRQAVDSGAKSWSAEYRFRCKNGSYSFVRDNAHLLRNSAGKCTRMVGAMRDLTEQKKTEAQYLRAQRMENIGTLAGGIAHDLNNVLTPIMLSIELLKLDSGDDLGQNKILDTIRASCSRGADLVRQVLSFARGLDGQRVAIELKYLVGDLKVIIGETFPRNIKIVTEVPAELWSIAGDPTQLHQVLLNLAVNARDAMPNGGTLTLTASNISVDAQYAGACRQASVGRHVVIQVSDTGIGIPPEIREHIFEPFFTTKAVGKGTGLGLATVLAIVKSHGGFVTVDSKVGVGATFKVFLPAELTLRRADTLLPFGTDLPRGRGELVLVVDDEESIRLITQKTLEAFGYRVITAIDGAEAVAIYARQAEQIAIVVTDMMMPTMDGAAAIHVLVRINPLVKIIAVSGLEIAENIAKVTSAGLRDFLAKPYTAQTLVRLVREVLDRPSAPTPLGTVPTG